MSTTDERVGHLHVKAIAAATDEGLFTAVISTDSVDREGDVVMAHAVVASLKQWAAAGRPVPLAWDHRINEGDQVIGHIDASTAHTVKGEVVASGWIDQSTEAGAHAWRIAKAGTLSFSFGFLITDAEPRPGGKGLFISGLDVFEVSAVMVPANSATRVLSTKALDIDAELADLEQHAIEHGHLKGRTPRRAVTSPTLNSATIADSLLTLFR